MPFGAALHGASMLKHIRTSVFGAICIAMAVFLALSMILAIHIGAVDLTPEWIYKILVNQIARTEIYTPQWPAYAEGIAWGIEPPVFDSDAIAKPSLSLQEVLSCQGFFTTSGRTRGLC